MDDTKNWYLRLTEKFFFDKEIIEIENMSQSRNGMFFSSFVIHLYLKMLCYSVAENGLIMIKKDFCDNDNISYMIAKMFGFETQQPYVEQALKILMRQGLIEIVDEASITNIAMRKLPNYVGSVKASSEKKQQRRLAAKNHLSLSDNTESNQVNEQKKVYGCMENVYLTKSEYDSLSNMESSSYNFKKVLERYSMDKITKHILYNAPESINDYEQLRKLLCKDETLISEENQEDNDTEF